MPGETKKDPELEKLEKELATLELLAKIEEQKKKLEPPDSDLAAAEKRAKEAELAAKTAEQEAKAFKAGLPESTATALEGKITIDDKTVIETETLAHKSLAVVAKNISKEVRAARPAVPDGTSKPKIFIYNETDIGALTAFRAYTGQMKVLGQQFDDIAQTGPAPLIGVAAIPLVTATLKSVVDLVALFRTDTDIKGVTVSLDELALASEVAGSLSDTHAVYISKLYPLEAVPATTLAGAQVQARLADVRRKATAAEVRVNAMPPGDDTAKKVEKEAKAAQQARLTELRAVLNAYEAALSKPAEQGVSTLGTLIRGETLEALMKDGSILYLKVLKAGGSNRVTRSLWSTKLTHSGGAIVNFVLFNSDGSVAKASMVSDYSGYRVVN